MGPQRHQHSNSESLKENQRFQSHTLQTWKSNKIYEDAAPNGTGTSTLAPAPAPPTGDASDPPSTPPAVNTHERATTAAEAGTTPPSPPTTNATPMDLFSEISRLVNVSGLVAALKEINDRLLYAGKKNSWWYLTSPKA